MKARFGQSQSRVQCEVRSGEEDFNRDPSGRLVLGYLRKWNEASDLSEDAIYMLIN